jgi:ribosomal protein S26
MTKPGDIVLEWSDDESTGHTLNAALLEGRSCICMIDKQETRDYVMKRMELLLNNDADLWEVRKKKSVAYGSKVLLVTVFAIVKMNKHSFCIDCSCGEYIMRDTAEDAKISKM